MLLVDLTLPRRHGVQRPYTLRVRGTADTLVRSSDHRFDSSTTRFAVGRQNSQRLLIDGQCLCVSLRVVQKVGPHQQRSEIIRLVKSPSARLRVGQIEVCLNLLLYLAELNFRC